MAPWCSGNSQPAGLALTAAQTRLRDQTVVVASSSNTASITDRAIRPLTLSPCQAPSMRLKEIRSRWFQPVDRTRYRIRIDPPPSDPSATGASPAATAAALRRCCRQRLGEAAGFRVAPKANDSVKGADHQLRHVGFADDDSACRAQLASEPPLRRTSRSRTVPGAAMSSPPRRCRHHL